MFRMVFLFLVLGAGLFVGTQYAGHQGYVLISFANKTIEMSVTTLVVFMVIALAALFFTEYVLKRALRATSNTWNWFSLRKLKRSRRYTNEGIIKLLEGDFKLAEKKVLRWANHHDMPMLCYLVAAEAAFNQGLTEKSQQYLAKAAEQEESDLAVGLTRAKQNIRSKHFEQAFDTLSSLKAQYRNNAMVLDLLKSVYVELKLWQPLIDIIPSLIKVNSISSQDAHHYTIMAQSGLIEDVAQQQGSEGLLAHWQGLTKKTKTEVELVVAMVKQLIERKADYEAFGLVKDTLKKQSSPELYQLIADMNLSDRHPARQFLSGIVKKQPENADAHSALGQLYLHDQQWPEAQKHFELALAKRSSVSDYAFLAEALEQQDLNQAARDVSRKALTLVKA
ncbi:heme biosynthesis protein HemY [Vibrio sp. WXL210]|uniref:heme biosynthesis protein HemY n=1 Tax=Vibrio sp. WXL210 TaxID=3450709 RepID=UPI003EC5FEB9